MHLFIMIAALTSVVRLDPSFEVSAKAQVESPQLLQAKCQLHTSFVECEGKTWFNPEGTLYLFEVVGDSAAIRVDQFIMVLPMAAFCFAMMIRYSCLAGVACSSFKLR